MEGFGPHQAFGSQGHADAHPGDDHEPVGEVGDPQTNVERGHRRQSRPFLGPAAPRHQGQRGGGQRNDRERPHQRWRAC
ncbi:MAG: hypothetical protein ACK56F_23950, partial [bacterium]